MRQVAFWFNVLGLCVVLSIGDSRPTVSDLEAVQCPKAEFGDQTAPKDVFVPDQNIQNGTWLDF